MKNSKSTIFIFIAITTLILVVATVLTIVLLSRGLGNLKDAEETEEFSQDLPFQYCPQEIIERDGQIIALTEGHVQEMTPENYEWVRNNCTYNKSL